MNLKQHNNIGEVLKANATIMDVLSLHGSYTLFCTKNGEYFKVTLDPNGSVIYKDSKQL